MRRPFYRGVLLATLAIALAFSVRPASRYASGLKTEVFGTSEEKAIAEIQGRDGTYKTDDTIPGHPIVKVDLSFADLGPTSLKRVGKLPHLRFLNLTETAVTDADIVPLSALTELTALNLMSTHVQALGLAAFRNLILLQTLNLQNTDLIDEGLAGITGLTALRSLNLSHTAVSDGALTFLETTGEQGEGADTRGLKQLVSLNLQGTRIQGEGLAHLAGLPRLRALSLAGSRITDEGLAGIAGVRASGPST